MKATPSMPAMEWSRGRWFGVVTALAVVQAGLVVALTRWPALPVPTAAPAVRLRLADGPANPRADESLWFPDPLLFGREDLRGFSGAAARSLPPSDYEVAEFVEAPQWLATTERGARIGGPPTIPVPESRRWPGGAPALAGENRPAPLLDKASRLNVRGGLAGRALTAAPDVLSWKSADILDVTVVEVGVTSAGDVFSARLVSSCNLAAADEAALTLARQVRLAPLNEVEADPSQAVAELVWGELAFHWQTEPAN